jgi:hypothetical protein
MSPYVFLEQLSLRKSRHLNVTLVLVLLYIQTFTEYLCRDPLLANQQYHCAPSVLKCFSSSPLASTMARRSPLAAFWAHSRWRTGGSRVRFSHSAAFPKALTLSSEGKNELHLGRSRQFQTEAGFLPTTRNDLVPRYPVTYLPTYVLW